MKKIYTLAVLLMLSGMAIKAQDKSTAKNTLYDSALAKKLGADQYGMKEYVMAFLKRGPKKIADATKAAEIQTAHLNNIGRLAKEGKLVVAGPFMDDQELRGIFIFNVKTIDEAKKLTESDPAIQAGVLVMELHPFYCTAALGEIVKIHNSIMMSNPGGN